MTYATLKNKNNSRQNVLVTESTKTLILVDHNTKYKINSIISKHRIISVTHQSFIVNFKLDFVSHLL